MDDSDALDEAEFVTPNLLTEEERQEVFFEQILPVFYGNCGAVSCPSVHFLGGQPGAGKSFLQQIVASGLKRDGNDSVATISIDDYREFHDHWDELLRQDDETAGAWTNQDCWEWSRLAMSFVLERGCHVICEGTLRNPGETLADVNEYLEKGFRTELHIVAVHEFVSRLRYLSRYLREVRGRGVGRFIPRSFHDEAYHVLPESVATMVESGMFYQASIHGGTGQVIEQVRADTPDAVHRVLTAVAEERNPVRLDEQALLDGIDRSLELARHVNRPKAVEELETLWRDVENGLSGSA